MTARQIGRCLIVVMGIVAAGCETTLPPRSAPVSTAPAIVAPQCASPVVTTAGDTVYSIARRCGISLRDLIEANALQPPYMLAPGTKLRLPGSSAEIVVAKGDTLIGLARRNHVDFHSLAEANNKAPPYVIKVGEHLRLPGSFGPAPASATSQVITSPLAGAQAPPAKPLPAAALPPPIASNPSQPTPKPPAQPQAPPPQQVAAVPAAPPPPAAPAAVSTAGFIWPVKGDVLLPYGPQAAKGQNNDGINIAAARGTPIRAVEGGVVAYVGNELKGFGNLVLIKHPDGWVSAYAHADQVEVKKGDSVTRGQEIGTVGQTGSVTQPQLHFELRKHGEAVDPEEYLPG